MKAKTFWIYLILVSIVTGIVLFIFHSFDIFEPHASISALFFGMMFLITVLLYYLGKVSIRSGNKYSFIRLVIISVMFKIVLVLLAVGLYLKFGSPVNRFFVLPLIAVYLMFNVFETIVLYRLAIEKPQLDHE